MGFTEFPRSEFIRRTMVNLAAIEAGKDRNRGPYEFTQLINSFLLAFIHPKKYWIDQFPRQSFPATGWPIVISKTIPQHENNAPTNTQELVVKIRNALAHGNFEIQTTGEGPSADIDSVRLWNTPNEQSTTVIWETEVGVNELHEILDIFVGEVRKIAAKNGE